MSYQKTENKKQIWLFVFKPFKKSNNKMILGYTGSCPMGSKSLYFVVQNDIKIFRPRAYFTVHPEVGGGVRGCAPSPRRVCDFAVRGLGDAEKTSNKGPSCDCSQKRQFFKN
jgi:hypothetical protein